VDQLIDSVVVGGGGGGGDGDDAIANPAMHLAPYLR